MNTIILNIVVLNTITVTVTCSSDNELTIIVHLNDNYYYHYNYYNYYNYCNYCNYCIVLF